MTRRDDWITIDERFCGPPRSGNGGYVCGLLAARLGGSVSVRLKAPPPIAKPLRIETREDGASLLDGSLRIAEASRRPLETVAGPRAPTLFEAERAASRFAGFTHHNFPTCFVCGPQRARGDGLRIFPGPVLDSDPVEPLRLDSAPAILAASWLPDPSLADAAGMVRSEFVWAALDCPGAFVRYPPPDGVAVVLGELAVESTEPVRAGEVCVVAAWSLGEEGRKLRAGTAIFDREGRVLARAHAVWIQVPAEIWR